MSGPRDLLRQYAAAKYVADIAKTRELAVKDALLEHIDPGDRKTVLAGDADIATVTRAKYVNKTTAIVTDEAALIEWARTHDHEHVITEALPGWFVRPENLEALIEHRRGEIPDGVELIERKTGGYLSIRQSTAQKATLVKHAALIAAVTETKELEQ